MGGGEAALIFAAGLAAGAINSVAGGGTLLSFPMLIWLGRDPVAANVANAVALWPASLASAVALRRELVAVRGWLLPLLLPSVVGAAAGAWLLLATPGRWFAAAVPILIWAATALIALRRPLLVALARRPQGEPRAGWPWGLAAAQLFVAIYGGYFGAAMGILMLAFFGLAGLGDIHQRNALKNVVAAVINGVAALFFASVGAVAWVDAALLGAGAMAGGYLGAAVGRKLPARLAEGLVVVIGIAAGVGQIMRAR